MITSEALHPAGPLTRAQGRELIQSPEAARERLLEQLYGPDAHQAVVLLGAVGRPEDASELIDLLDETVDDELRHEILQTLSRFGASILPTLEERLEARDQTLVLSWMALLRPADEEAVVRHLAELLDESDAEGTGFAIIALDDLDRREYIPDVERHIRNPQVADFYGPGDLEHWKGRPPGKLAMQDLPPSDPLESLPPDHVTALLSFARKMADLREDGDQEWNSFVRRFLEDLFDLKSRLQNDRPTVVKAGRNDACPCGSGKKFKKCCLEQSQEESRPDPLAARLATVVWHPLGMRLTPTEQLELLPREEVLEFLDILALPSSQVRRRAEREQSDYHLWACALNLKGHHDLEGATSLAAMVAASDSGHPALDYKMIAVHGSTPRGTLRGLHTTELALEQSLGAGRFLNAMSHACDLYDTDQQTGLRAFEKARDVFPDVHWVAAYLAGSALERGRVEPALPLVRQALERADSGHSRGPGEAPELVCPAEVLRGYLEQLEYHQVQHQKLERRLRDILSSPLPPDLRLELELANSHCLQGHGTRRVQELLPQVLAVDSMLILAESPGQVVVLVRDLPEGLGGAFPWHRAPGHPDALANVLIEVVRSIRSEEAVLEKVSFVGGGWRLRVSPPEEDLAEMVELLLEEPLSAIRVPLQALELQVVAPPETSDLVLAEPDSEPTLEEYLRRLLRRLLRLRKVGGAHTEIGLFARGIPKRWRGAAMELLDILIDHNYVRLKPTLKDPHISLEPGPIAEIKLFIQGGPPPDCLVEALERSQPARMATPVPPTDSPAPG